MMEKVAIVMIIVERIAYAVIGLIAAMNGEGAWAITMAALLWVLVFCTNVRITETNVSGDTPSKK